MTLWSRIMAWIRGDDRKALAARAEECGRVVRHGARNAEQSAEAVIWAARRHARTAAKETETAEAVLSGLAGTRDASQHHP